LQIQLRARLDPAMARHTLLVEHRADFGVEVDLLSAAGEQAGAQNRNKDEQGGAHAKEDRARFAR